MNTNNLMSRSVKRVNRSTVRNLAIDLVELSEKDLQRVVGGVGDPCGGGMFERLTITYADGSKSVTEKFKPCTCVSVQGKRI